MPWWAACIVAYCAMVAYILLRKPADLKLTWRRALGVCCWPVLLVRALIREWRWRRDARQLP